MNAGAQHFMTINGVATHAASKKSNSLYINRSFHLGVLVAPDVSTVGGAAADKLSSNWGFSIGYQLTDRLSLNTGVIFSTKYYNIFSDNFHLPPGSRFPGYDLEFVKGNCNMIEIPLALRYDFSSLGKTNFFVSGGLSSYMMQHENYQYYYHSYNGGSQLYRHDSSYDTHSNYWMSVISLSIGVEQKLSRSLSLQAEPFVKIPVTGIGFGNIQLNSYGILFSLRFSPELSKKRR